MSSPGHSSLPADARRPEGATDDATRYRAFLEQDAVGAEIGLAGRFLTANARFCGIAGHPWEELRELHFQDITGPEDRRPGRTEVRSRVRT